MCEIDFKFDVSQIDLPVSNNTDVSAHLFKLFCCILQQSRSPTNLMTMKTVAKRLMRTLPLIPTPAMEILMALTNLESLRGQELHIATISWINWNLHLVVPTIQMYLHVKTCLLN